MENLSKKEEENIETLLKKGLKNLTDVIKNAKMEQSLRICGRQTNSSFNIFFMRGIFNTKFVGHLTLSKKSLSFKWVFNDEMHNDRFSLRKWWMKKYKYTDEPEYIVCTAISMIVFGDFVGNDVLAYGASNLEFCRDKPLPGGKREFSIKYKNNAKNKATIISRIKKFLRKNTFCWS